MIPVQRPVLLLVLFCLAAAVAVLVLRPGVLLQLEADLSEMTPEAALEELGGYVAYGPEEQGIALIHAQLALESGDLPLTRDLMRDLATNFPEDASLRDLQGHVEELSGDPAAAADHLAEAYRLDPTPARRDRLGLLYRLMDQPVAEAALLLEAPAHELSESDVHRAVELRLAEGNLEDVERFYRELGDGAPEIAELSRDRLVTFLIDLGRTDDAHEVALAWIERNRFDSAVSSAMIRSFVARGDLDHALQIASYQLGVRPQGMGRIVLRFAETGHGAIARNLQAEWLARSPALSDEDWAALSEMAARTGDLSGLRNALSRPETPSPERLGEALLQFLRYYGSQALLPYRAHAGPALSDAAPLVGAAFALEMSRPDEAAGLLALARTEGLGAWDQSLWQSLAARLEETGVPMAGRITP